MKIRVNAPARQGFTILELLLVIGIIALLMGLGIPAFIGINKGASMRAAERQVAGGNALARQQAVTGRQRVVFCIPYKILTDNNYVRPDMLYRSYALLSQATKGVARPAAILGKVETLPGGVVFTNAATCYNGWGDYTVIDDTGNNLFKAWGFRYAATGAVHYEDAVAIKPAVGYRMILTEGQVSEAGVIAFTAGGITSTQEVRSASGRCTLLR